MGIGVLGQWFFTAVFVALAAHSGWMLVGGPQAWTHRVGRALHLIMALDMAAMMWPWWDRVPVLGQLVVFGAGLVWYAVLGLRRLVRRTRPDVRTPGVWAAALHAVMMAAMLWMVVAMGLPADHAAGHDHAALSWWAALLGVAATVGLVVAGVATLVTTLESSGRRTRALGTADAAMCLAMGTTCWAMLLE